MNLDGDDVDGDVGVVDDDDDDDDDDDHHDNNYNNDDKLSIDFTIFLSVLS